ncbi:MAG: 30S ribosomal protein S18 [Candidatus Cloacimonadota bacterium]|nr:MAG: 30S ribosomal protein S18 [Candidatus Cloacimonadota bacterium]
MSEKEINKTENENIEKTTNETVVEEKAKEEPKKESSYKRSYNDRNRRYNKKNKFVFTKKVCYFCKNKDVEIDYKDVSLMKRFIAENGKITPRRFTGTCSKHQRKLATEIKKARQMALIHYTD